ncbi:DUF309 domain-containing protein [Halobacillus sp. A5]|uniref:DUF309 domain-containing protein n=1 Tax=Halobacillus sp. A5 TaxID=2880263 RepID=UPI0020A631AD|nr:DUF309 domain-containing protein [Halobacillus sp. A5]MCP3025806.1 DUF309 domain-containing protein [Halobacillus sp. A5]
MYPFPYIEFLAHFHGTRDYFECHEVLEDYWKKVEPGKRDSVWVLLIQFAVSLYHYRRGNSKGGIILIQKSLNKLPANRKALSSIGINVNEFQNLMLAVKKRMEADEAYESVSIPINVPALKEEVKALCMSWEVSFESSSDLTDEKLVHRHKKHNRT